MLSDELVIPVSKADSSIKAVVSSILNLLRVERLVGGEHTVQFCTLLDESLFVSRLVS